MVKRILVRLLAPIAWVADKLEGWRRLWAHARLRTSLKGRLDSSVVVLGIPEIHGTKNITLGRNLYLYRELYWETQTDASIDIGDDVVMSRGVHLVAFAGIHIGSGVMIGEYSSIRDANHLIQPGQSPRHTGHEAKPIHIQRNVWIGRGVTILGGVTIGEGAVIGANAVVTRNVSANAVAVGVPARIIHKAPD